MSGHVGHDHAHGGPGAGRFLGAAFWIAIAILVVEVAGLPATIRLATSPTTGELMVGCEAAAKRC
jgi:hypothetical protein